MQNFRREIIYPLLVASLIVTGAMGWVFSAAYNLMEIGVRKDRIDALRFNIISLQSNIVDAETGQRGYIITNNATFLEPYENAQRKTGKLFSQISRSYKYFPELEPIFIRVKKLTDEKFQIIQSSIQVQLNAGSYASHLTLSRDRGKLVMDRIQLELKSADDSLLVRKHKIEDEIKESLKRTILGSVFLVLVIVGVLTFSYRRTVVLFEQAIEHRIEAEKQNYQATHDSLTKISNRRDFEHYLRKIHIVSQRKSDQYAIFSLDLDEFKAVNDELGHEAGDFVLVGATERFLRVLRESDFLARLGGDEFALIVHRYKDLSELQLLANRIIQSLAAPFPVGSQYANIGVSIGIACYPSNGSTTDKLLAAADAAMYKSKKTGKNKISFA